MNEVFIVLGRTGEYSDRTEWTVCAFLTEEEAKAEVEFLTAKRMEVCGPGYLDWDARNGIEEKMRVFDPSFSEDYTGTSWWMERVPVGAFRPQSPSDGSETTKTGNSGITPYPLSGDQ